MYREKLFEVSATAVRSSVILPSIISHLLQLLRGECCHVRTSLLQSLELCWSQHWVTIKEKQLSKQLALFLPPTYKKNILLANILFATWWLAAKLSLMSYQDETT